MHLVAVLAQAFHLGLNLLGDTAAGVESVKYEEENFHAFQRKFLQKYGKDFTVPNFFRIFAAHE